MKRIILFLGCCLLGWGTTNLMAQQGNVAAGGQATGSGGSVSYSIGLVDYLSASGSNGSIVQGLQHPGGYSLCGTLTYGNAVATVMNNSTVLLKLNGSVVSQATTDAMGYYQFFNPEAGGYTLDATTTKPWGSVNAADALLVQKHFTAVSFLSGLKLAAGDVNGSGYVNTSDALLIQKRFVGLSSSFSVGDWVFEHPTATVANANLVVDFQGLCFGDVDGSYVPGFKTEPSLFLENQGFLAVNQNQIITVPVSLKQAGTAAAASLIMSFPSEIEILGVEAAYDNQSLVYNTIGNELRIAWYTLAPKNLNAGDDFMYITMKLNGNTNGDLSFELNPESAINDFEAITIENNALVMPKLVNNFQGFSLSQNIPNPFSSTTQISYTLPESAVVKLELLDVVGQLVSVLENGQRDAGSHNYILDANILPDGVYFYRMTVSAASQQFSQTKRMVISR